MANGAKSRGLSLRPWQREVGEAAASGKGAAGRDDEGTLELLERCRQGDRQAFDMLISLHARWVRTVVRSRCVGQDETWVQETVAEIIEQVWSSLSGFRGDCYFRRWVYSICRHVCASRCRRDKTWRRRTQPLGEDTEYADDSAVSLDGEMMLHSVRKAIGGLPHPMRMAITLRYQGEFSYRQIADTLGISERLVKSRIFEGRKRLRAELDGEFGEGPG
jgi:RNA polymerase sigma-70 factor (ECF subfamily)